MKYQWGKTVLSKAQCKKLEETATRDALLFRKYHTRQISHKDNEDQLSAQEWRRVGWTVLSGAKGVVDDYPRAKGDLNWDSSWRQKVLLYWPDQVRPTTDEELNTILDPGRP